VLAGSYGFYGLLNWLPSFFQDAYHVEVKDLGGFTLLPFLVQGAVGAASGGRVGMGGRTDRLCDGRGHPVTYAPGIG